MGLNITNEMNICTFFHGVSAFREFHSFIVLNMCLCRIHTLSVGRIRARLLLPQRAYVFIIDDSQLCQCVRSANNIFFQSHTFFSVDLLHML